MKWKRQMQQDDLLHSIAGWSMPQVICKIYDIYGNKIDPEIKANSLILNVTESPVCLLGEFNMPGK